MKNQMKVYMFDLEKTSDDFPCGSCTDEEFISESERQGFVAEPLDLFERKFNIKYFSHRNEFPIIRFI
jgi:hypothetical protein